MLEVIRSFFKIELWFFNFYNFCVKQKNNFRDIFLENTNNTTGDRLCGVFCQTIMKSCQITNNMLEISSRKYCQNSATCFFIKRFTLSLDPILIVLLQLTIFRQKSESAGV